MKKIYLPGLFITIAVMTMRNTAQITIKDSTMPFQFFDSSSSPTSSYLK